jgi:S1-C subfamily serine protease
LIGFVAVAVLAAPFASAQDDKVAKSLGLTKDAGALPLWSKATLGDKQELGKNARRLEQAVFLVGYPKNHGTGWVISKKHRLLVTNAHVADILVQAGGNLMAIPNGTTTLYKVEKIWYHPGVRRYLQGHPLSVRATDPKEGPVDPTSPDLAILQLSSSGPDLTAEFELALPQELDDMLGQPTAIFGFPGHDTAWPRLGENPAATFHDGVVSRLTNFELSGAGNPAERQLVQYTMATWGGFSGSPVFFPSGRVVAVHNMARPVENKSTGEKKWIPHGIRVDCVWEMLAFHKLDDKVPLKVDKSKLLIARWSQPDERTEKIRQTYAKANELLREARTLIYTKEEYFEGVNKCNEAIKLVPSLADAYHARCHGYTNYWFNNRRKISDEDGFRMLKEAAKNADMYVKLLPSDPDGYILRAIVFNNIGHSTEDYDHNRNALELMNKILSTEGLSTYSKAEAHSQRAVAWDNVGDKDRALADHNTAIRLRPEEPVYYENRADFWHYLGRTDLEAADYAKARELRKKK